MQGNSKYKYSCTIKSNWTILANIKLAQVSPDWGKSHLCIAVQISYSPDEVQKTRKELVNLLETVKLLGLKIKNKITKDKRPETAFILFCKRIQISGWKT